MNRTGSLQVTSEQQQATTALTGKRFISDREVEAIYGTPRKTLQNLRVLGRGPMYRKFGKSVRYDVRSVEAWIESLPCGGAGVPSSAVKKRLMKAEQNAKHLDGHRIAAGKWQARCPAHDDRSPSLSIREGRNGRTLICCHAGCTVTAILKASGLQLRDLFDGRQRSPEQMRAANRGRERLEVLRQARRVKGRFDIEFMRLLERRLDTVVRELGRELALMADNHPGAAALTAKFHAVLTAYQFADRCIVGYVR